MREKIAEIVCNHCEKIACPFKSKGLMCSWLEDYVLKELAALIASEQQPMVEALQDGKMQLYAGILQIEYLQTKFRETGSGNGQIAQMRHTIAKIDAALKGEGK